MLSLPALAVEDIFVTDTMRTLPSDLSLRACYLQALCYKKSGKPDSARMLLEKYVAEDSTNAAVYMDLANMCISARQPELASAYMAKAARLEPDNYWIQRANALLRAQTGDIKAAISGYQAIADKYPQKTDDLQALASLYEQNGQQMQAIATWNKYESETGINEQVSTEKARLYLGLNKRKQAIAEMDKLIQSDPSNLRYYLIKGNVYSIMGDHKRAEKLYKQLDAKFPNQRSDISRQLATLYLDQHRDAEAVVLMKQLIADSTLDFESRRSLFVSAVADSSLSLYFSENDYRNFIRQNPMQEGSYLLYANYLLTHNNTAGFDYVRQAIKVNPHNAASWLILIDYYQQMNDSVRYASTLSEALAANPENGTLHFYQGSLDMERGHDSLALRQWKQAATLLSADNSEKQRTSLVYGVIADVYMQKSGMADSAYYYYELALASNPDNALVLNNYAYTLAVNNGDLDKAERLSGRSLQKDPKSVTFLDTYAWIYFKQGNYATAKMYIQQAVNYGGDKDADVLEHYGDILYKNGEEAEGVKAWNQAVSIAKNPSALLMHKVETGKYFDKLDKEK
jgi:tetratricopeptide (TPR) repeat protein